MFTLHSQLPVQTIHQDDYDNMLDKAELIVADRIAPKVMQLENGNFIKLFRRKRWLSTAMFAPYAVRFANNAIQLKALDIPCITPVKILHCVQAQTHIVEYEPLPGRLLRGELAQSQDEALFTTTAVFIATLHNRGIYFRSLHFENVVVTEHGLGLIDVADMKIHNTSLPRRLRIRNFQHFMRYPQDAALIQGFGEEKFHDIYTSHTH